MTHMFQRIKPEFQVPHREVAATDRAVAANLAALDQLLDEQAARPTRRMDLIDQLLDERLYLRPPDVMATGRPS